MDKDTNKNEPIVLNPGMAGELVKEFGCSHKTVKNAITYQGDSLIHRAIRLKAKKMVNDYMSAHGIEQTELSNN